MGEFCLRLAARTYTTALRAPSMPSRKIKLYTITVEDTTMLNENDEHLSPDLNRLHTTLESQEDIHTHTSFSEVDFTTLTEANIQSSLLILSEDKMDEIKALGKADVGSTSLSFDATAQLIKLVRNHVSTVTEAGCRTLVNIILLHLASTMESNESRLNIVPEFPIPQTVFKTSTGKHSFGGVVDYLLASGPPWAMVLPTLISLAFIALGNPVDILANPQMAQYFTIAPAGIIK
ncbi:hypothetical protein JOM56_008644, partial [Amanita muscaria]